ncbi:MAG: outer membrane beta-barrel protein [Aureispira sp.]
MKNLTLLVAALLLAGHTFGQSGLELTAGYTPGISFVLNDDDFAEGEALNYQVTYGSQLGLTVGYNFSEKVGVMTGFGLASINQNYISDYDNRTKENQSTFNRKTTYIRIPLMVRIGGDPTAPSSAFFRFGPHFDFLASAEGDYDTFIGIGNVGTRVDGTINYRDDNFEGAFSNSVIGLTMEVGGRIRISDVMGVLLLFHLESSLTNPEGDDAANFFVSNSAGERAGSFNVMPGINVSFQYVLSFE